MLDESLGHRTGLVWACVFGDVTGAFLVSEGTLSKRGLILWHSSFVVLSVVLCVICSSILIRALVFGSQLRRSHVISAALFTIFASSTAISLSMLCKLCFLLLLVRKYLFITDFSFQSQMVCFDKQSTQMRIALLNWLDQPKPFWADGRWKREDRISIANTILRDPPGVPASVLPICDRLWIGICLSAYLICQSAFAILVGFLLPLFAVKPASQMSILQWCLLRSYQSTLLFITVKVWLLRKVISAHIQGLIPFHYQSQQGSSLIQQIKQVEIDQCCSRVSQELLKQRFGHIHCDSIILGYCS